MSRYTIKLENGHTVNYGFDHALGYWIDEIDPGADLPVWEISSAFDGVDGLAIVAKLHELELNEQVPFDHYACMCLGFVF